MGLPVRGAGGSGRPSKETVKKVAIIIGILVAVFTVYTLIVRSDTEIGFYCYCAYYIFFTVLLIAVIVLNGGFSKDVPTPEQLRESWSDKKKEKFIARLKTGKKWAKRLMYLLVPVMITIMFDLAYTFFLADLLAKLA